MPPADATLRLVVRTPRETVAEIDARSLRVPTDTGQIGLRPRSEPAVIAVEPGLVLVRAGSRTSFVATAGGLLRCEKHRAVLLTPLAVVGDDAGDVRARLDRALATPSAELELRRAIGRLEAGILGALRQPPAGASGRPEVLP